jgi:hypothetical protein
VRSSSDVDLILVLALDVSSSVDRKEFELQRRGLSTAFRHPQVIKAILRGRSRRIAVATVQWAGYRQQAVVLPWTVIANAAEALAYAERIGSMSRAYPDGATHLGGIIEAGSALALTAPFAALRRVIDISGDGVDNVGGQPRKERAAAVAAGLTINGLAIANEVSGLPDYFRDYVIGGPGAFVMTAQDYDDFPRAILQKLIREIETQLMI